MQNKNRIRRAAGSRCSAAILGILVTLCDGWAGAAADPPQALIPESGIRAHMGFLAGDALNGRGSGTRDEWIAASYLAAQAQRIGLEPVSAGADFVQTVDLERVAVDAPPILAAGPLRYSHGAQVLFNPLNSGAIEGPLLRFRPGMAVPPGAVLLMPEDAPRGVPTAAARAGLLLWRETGPVHEHWQELAQRPLTLGATRIAGIDRPAAAESAPVSQGWLTAEAYTRLAALAGQGRASVHADGHAVVSSTWNTVARLPGTDPSQPAILLSAHLDHLGARDGTVDRIYNGADDDASGCVAVLALAEALTHGPPLHRTVVFAWFGSEEAGGFGARYFVQKPVVPLDRLAANIEFEMIGRVDPAIDAHSLWLTGWERSDLGPALARHGARLVADPHPRENFFVRSDNIALARQGVVAHTVSSFGLHGDYHQPSDELGRIDFPHMVESIRSLYEPIRWLADDPFVPRWNPGQKP